MLVVLGLASVVGTDMLSVDVGEELSKIVHGLIAPFHKQNLFFGKKVSIMWSMYGHFGNRPGAVFELNHSVAMKQCSPVISHLSPIFRDTIYFHMLCSSKKNYKSFFLS